MRVQLLRSFFQTNPWLRRALWGLAGLLLLWAVAWLALPPWLRGQLAQQASAQLGRSVTVGAVEFTPWSLELTVRDVAVARAGAAPGDAPQFSLERLYIDAELQSLWRLAPVLDAVQIQAPQGHVTYLGEGRYDIDDILARWVPADDPAGAPKATPLPFALFNVVLSQGRMEVIDQATGQTHTLQDVSLQVPFISNMASRRAVLVTPQLGFELNGSRFDSRAQGTPFAETARMQANLAFSQLDLRPYLAYWPATLPVKLGAAVLSGDLNLAFEQTPEPSVKLSGTVQADQVQVLGAGAGTPWLSFDRLSLNLADVRPLEKRIHLAQLELTAPKLNAARDAAGRINLTSLLAPAKANANTSANTSASATKTIAATPSTARAGGQNDAQELAWQVQLDALAVRQGRVQWVDDRVAPQARLTASEVQLDAQNLAWPMAKPAPFEGSLRLAGAGTGTAAASFKFSGQATDTQAQVNLRVGDLPLSFGAPYVAAYLQPTLSGVLQAETDLQWRSPTPGSASPDGALVVRAAQWRLDDLLLSQGPTRLASIQQVSGRELELDLGRQSVRVAQISVRQPQITLARDAQGQWAAQSWVRQAIAPTATVAPRAATLVSPWAWSVAEFQLSEGAVAWRDASSVRPVAFDVAALSLQVKNATSSGTKPMAVSLSSQLRTPGAAPGRLSWDGQVGLTPLAAQGKLALQRLPLQAFEPYLAPYLNLALQRADATLSGQMSVRQLPAGPVVSLAGDLAIEHLSAQTLAGVAPGVAPGEPLLNWQSLQLRGLSLASAPDAATRVSVDETTLSDFYARVVLDATGRLNLQDLTKPAASPAAPPSSVQAAPETIAASPITIRATGQNNAQAVTPAVLAPVVRFGPVRLAGGRVDFSDRFIQPNYSAQLTELAGSLSAFASQNAEGGGQLAELVLRGRAQGTATLDIQGQLNPLLDPLALAIQGHVRDLDLSPLSPYAVRYAGHGIERGKLNMDVDYQLQPNGQLTARNQLVLKQLGFGEPVPGAPASLPVKLAVALLADRQGVIDLDLPISGSLNDPEFRIGAVVFKIIGNLLTKAITAPFSLLAQAFGGGDEMSRVDFAQGSAELSSQARSGLDQVVQALLARPALTLTVAGSASQASETDAIKRAQLQRLVQAQAPAGGEGADYEAQLRAVYKQTAMTKPRNAIGLAKTLSVPEMEALLLANLSVSSEQVRALAGQRAAVVRDYLLTQAMPLERLFLGAPRIASSDAPEPAAAQLSLALP